MQFCKDCQYLYYGDWGGHTAMCSNPIFASDPDPISGNVLNGYCDFIRKKEYKDSCPGFVQKIPQKKTRLEKLISIIVGGD